MPHSSIFSSTRFPALSRASAITRVVAATAVGLAISLLPAVTTAQDKAGPDLAAGEQIAATVCVACHGADGNSPTSANPIIAGQHAEYLTKQLHDFKPGEGGEATRPSALMSGFAAGLSDADIRNVSAYFAAQEMKPVTASEKDLVELGQQIYRGGIASKGVPACAACHGPTGAGLPVQYPLVHGQYAEYTAAELTKFRQGDRRNSAQMTDIASRMSDAEIRAVSDYIAGLR